MSFSNELDVRYEYDFLLFGIVSSAKDYKLAWSINQALQIRLVKAHELEIEVNKDHSIIISNFIFKTSHCTFRLLKNKAYTADKQQWDYFLPDQQQVDYLLMIKDGTETIGTEDISAKMNAIPDIESLILFDVHTLLFKDNLIF